MARPGRATGAQPKRKLGRYLSQGSLKLRAWRRSHKLTQIQAAEEIGLDYSVLIRLERGERRASVAAAVAIQRAAGIRPDRWTEPVTDQEKAREILSWDRRRGHRHVS